MAPEIKEKKRKATTSVVPSDSPLKKSKKASVNDSVTELKTNPRTVSKDVKDQQKIGLKKITQLPQVAAPVTQNNEAVIASKKSRKRAADFLDDEEGAIMKETAAAKGIQNVEGETGDTPEKVKKSKKTTVEGKVPETEEIIVVTEVTTEETPAAATDKPKRTKKSKKANTEEEVDRTEGSDGVVTQTVNEFTAVTTVKVANKPEKKVGNLGPVAVTVGKAAAATGKTEPLQKKKIQSTSQFHANRLEKLLDTPFLDWSDKASDRQAQKQAEKQTLTASGVNGVIKHGNKEKLDSATVNDNVSFSLQTEAQNTLDHELEEEYGTDEEADDQGTALLAGFDSDTEDLAEDEDFDPDALGLVPNAKKTNKKLKKALAKGNADGPGTVYVGRIPHGFYEHQMRAYFSQFGAITRLRLSRNRRTGASKHFAFIEFESSEVAKIVANTMDNYLMFGHILKCKYAPQESLHPDLWKGANKRFKKVPYNKLEKKRLEAPKTKEQWEYKIDKEQKKREAKAEELKKIGYKMELPKLKTPDEVLERKKLQKTDEPKATEPAEVVTEDSGPTGALEPSKAVPKDEIAKVVSKKEKKGRKEKESGEASVTKAVEHPAKAKSEAVDAEVETPPTVASAIPAAAQTSDKKGKRKQKRNLEKPLQKELAQLSSEGEPSTYQTVVTAPAESSIPLIVSNATEAADSNADGVKRRRKRKPKAKRASSVDGVVALPTLTQPTTATTVTLESKAEKTEKPKVEKIEKPKVETIEKPKVETIEKPKVEKIEKPKVEKIEKSKVEKIEKPTVEKTEKQKKQKKRKPDVEAQPELTKHVKKAKKA